MIQWLWLSIPFYNLALILSKLSALALFTRIFHHRTFLIATYITMASIILSGLWMVTSGFVFCIPVHSFWSLNRTNHAEDCLPEGPVWYSNAAIQILTDIVILLLPMPLLSNLHLPQRQKAGIIVVFCVGIMVIATSSARLYELSTMIRGGDFTLTNSNAAVWSSLEANVSLICACLPPLYPLISRVFSFCFRPQPLHSSPASRYHSNTTQLTSTTHPISSRKPSVYDHTIGADGGVFYNDFFYAGPGGYSASIANMGHQTKDDEPDLENGIRVVKELTMVTDQVDPLPLPSSPIETRKGDFEMGRYSKGSGSKSSNPSIEWDLGEFEFPDYKDSMNCPL